MSEYLWDRTGEPDPEVLQLEAALRPLRRIPPAPVLETGGRLRHLADWRALGAAASVAVALLALATRTPPRGAGESWSVAWLQPAQGPVAQVDREGRLAVGEWMDTGGARARLEVGRIGEVTLEPATRVGLLEAGQRVHRLSLAHGTLHAMVWAPPGQFVVDTRAALAVDLGCEYTLTVDERGTGLLRVETGWVGFEHRGLQSLVPAGAICRTYGGRGPGTPRFQTAAAPFAEALDILDSGASGVAADGALTRVLAEARPRDALSLWHLLSRVEPSARGRVYDRLAVLVPPPGGVTREGIVRGDTGMRDRWWDELGLGSAEFWREWTRRWTGAPSVSPPRPANDAR